MHPNGDVYWYRMGVLTAMCTFTMLKFPDDVQNCEFKFGSWAYSAEQIEMKIWTGGTGPAPRRGLAVCWPCAAPARSVSRGWMDGWLVVVVVVVVVVRGEGGSAPKSTHRATA